jgi:hypothetical protein
MKHIWLSKKDTRWERLELFGRKRFEDLKISQLIIRRFYRIQTSDFKLRTSDFGLQTSGFKRNKPLKINKNENKTLFKHFNSGVIHQQYFGPAA